MGNEEPAEAAEATEVNPALELYGILDGWRVVPGNQTPLDARSENEKRYWKVHSRALVLVDEIEDYLQERADMLGQEMFGMPYLDAIRIAINTPGAGLGSPQSTSWTAIDNGVLEWLGTIGQSWSRSRLARHPAALDEVYVTSKLLRTYITDAEGVAPMHRDYMLTLVDALDKSARLNEIYGEAPTARLAMELVGALEVFAPTEDADVQGVLHRLKAGAKDLWVYVGQPTLQILANPTIQQAITSGMGS